ncbi:MAG: tetratricopeptide repeat protein [Anaerolineae bacterium]|nr:tetratricopeptide repeat protein [Anaerolineae bacterium]
MQAHHQAQYDTSFRYYQEAHQAFQQLGDGLGQLRALINMAIVHNLLGQFHG